VYINSLTLANDINTSAWGNFNNSGETKIIYEKFGLDGINAEDYTISNKAISAQMTTNSTPWIKPDRSNFELMIVKAIKLTYVESNIRALLQQAHQDLIDPGY